MTIRVLLVCTGNTCRSQMAQAICTDLVNKTKDPISFDSAGIRANLGDATTGEAIKALSAKGISWGGRSKPVAATMLAQADEVWVMTEEHQQHINTLLQGAELEAASQVSLLAGDRELIDPLGRGLAAYETLYSELIQLLPMRIKALLARQQA